MATYKLLLLPGDGIGPEVMAEVKKLITWMNARGMGRFETEEGSSGVAAMTLTRSRSPTRPWPRRTRPTP